jgi:parallel beta-helix repeat protein
MKIKGCLLMLILLCLSATACVNAREVVGEGVVGDSAFITQVLSDEDKPTKKLYVSETGSDKNVGSITAPFKTVNKALSVATAGTTVYVRGGTYSENIRFTKSGRAGAYITIKNYGDEKPIIKGTNKNDRAIIETDGHDYIKIEGLELCDYSARWCYGILLSGGENHVIIRRNSIHNIKCTNPNDPDNSGANGILLFGETKEPISNIYIGENEIYDLVTGWCEALSVTANCEYVNVVNNRVGNITNIGIDFYGNNADGYCPVESLNQPRYCVAIGNEVYGCVCDYSTSYGIYVDGARDIVLDSNRVYNNQGGIEVGSEERNEKYPVKNITVSNNLVYNNTENGITVGGWNDGTSKDDALSGVVYDVSVTGNTVTNSGEALHIAMVDGLEVQGNAFSTDKSTPLVVSDVAAKYIKNLTFKDNTYYSDKATANNVKFELYGKTQIGMTAWKKLTGETGRFANCKSVAD